ncbi:hypothetical protein EDD86DRAFT_250549 [Gorgonomyces haynaldii]|nr:hypothetical protein EDD86DRAFT_250549 [Gorgonomyces haynaldii]
MNFVKSAVNKSSFAAGPKKPQSRGRPIVVQKPTIVEKEPETVQEQEQQQEQVTPVVETRGNRIAIPIQQPKPVVHQPSERRAFDENTASIHEFTIADLITSHFSRGELSKKEKLRIEEEEKQEVDSMPQFAIIDGVLQIDPQSIKRKEASYESMERVEEEQERYVTNASFRNKKPTKDGLSYFGPNPDMICLMFPGLTQKQIKAKFKHEDRKNPKRVTEAMINPKSPPQELMERMMASIPDKKVLERKQYYKVPPEEDIVVSKEKLDDALATIESAQEKIPEPEPEPVPEPVLEKEPEPLPPRKEKQTRTSSILHKSVFTSSVKAVPRPTRRPRPTVA